MDLETDHVAFGDVLVGHVFDGDGLAVRGARFHVFALRAFGERLEDLGGARAVLRFEAGVGYAVAVAVEAYGAVEGRFAACPAQADVWARFCVASFGVDGVSGAVDGYTA